MRITKKIIDLIVYAHENGIEMQEFEAVDATVTDVVDDDAPKKKTGKKYSYTSKKKSENPTGASISDKDTKTMRQFISVQKALGKLSDAQVTAIDATKGISLPDLTLGQREQIKNIFEDLKK